MFSLIQGELDNAISIRLYHGRDINDIQALSQPISEEAALTNLGKFRENRSRQAGKDGNTRTAHLMLKAKNVADPLEESKSEAP